MVWPSKSELKFSLEKYSESAIYSMFPDIEFVFMEENKIINLMTSFESVLKNPLLNLTSNTSIMHVLILKCMASSLL